MSGSHRAPTSTLADYRGWLASGSVLLLVVGIATVMRLESTEEIAAPTTVAASADARLPVYTLDAQPPVVETTTAHAATPATTPKVEQDRPNVAVARPTSQPTTTPARPRASAPTTAPAERPSAPPRSAPKPTPPAPAAKPAPAHVAAPAPAAPPPSGPLGGRIVAYARALASKHIPYVLGGKTEKGFDCSGFVWYVLNHVGHAEPYRMSGALKSWAKAIPASAATPGDLVFYPGHVAIYVGNGKVIDAGSSALGVTERKMWAGATFGRIPDIIS